MPHNEAARFSTGNEFVSLDDIDGESGALRSLAFLHEFARGVLQLAGGEVDGFLQPSLLVDGETVPMTGAEWRLLSHWIPQFQLATPAGRLECTFLAPPLRRGFLLRLEFRASRATNVRLAFDLDWATTCHVSGVPRRMRGERMAGVTSHRLQDASLEFHSGWPRFGLGLLGDEDAVWEIKVGDADVEKARRELAASARETISGSISRALALNMGEQATLTLCVGLGPEARAGQAVADDLQNEGWIDLLANSQEWLEEHTIGCRGEAFSATERLNHNALYNYFYSGGVTIDTERMVVTSSRSPRWHLAGSYSDRDACLYSVPAVLLIDPAQARRMLEYIFSVQIRNVGAFLRYLDGVTLQPGFALDAVASPLRCLWMYVDLTDDLTILFDSAVQSGLNRILDALEQHAHDEVPLYATRLAPGGGFVDLKYNTYDNVLVWRALVDLSNLYHRIRDVEREHDTEAWARDVREAVLRYCIVDGPYGPMFCRATDLEGRAELGDDPEGSLALIAHLEFCRPDYPAFQNTRRWVREHYASTRQDGLSVITMANELLAGNNAPLKTLQTQGLDSGRACGMPDSGGRAESELGWAACAGYMTYAMVRALEDYITAPVLTKKSPRSSRISRSTLQPGIGWI